ncbi:MAG: hypothetical protein WBD48_14295 [Pseudolabrys sp.]
MRGVAAAGAASAGDCADAGAAASASAQMKKTSPGIFICLAVFQFAEPFGSHIGFVKQLKRNRSRVHRQLLHCICCAAKREELRSPSRDGSAG